MNKAELLDDHIIRHKDKIAFDKFDTFYNDTSTCSIELLQFIFKNLIKCDGREDLTSAGQILIDFLLYFNRIHEENQDVDISQIAG